MHFGLISEKILFFVCGFGILQGILLAGLLYFHPKSDRSVNVFFALHIFCISIVMTIPFILRAIPWQNSFFIQPFPLLPGPLLYLYLRSFKERIGWRKILPHLLPFLLFFFPAYWNKSELSSRFPDAKEVPGAVLQSPVTIILMNIRLAIYMVYYFLARKTLITYQRSIHHLFSETSRFDLQWARLLINGYLFLILTFMVIFPLMLRFPGHVNLLMLINMAVATPYIYLATYKGIMQPTIWQIQSDVNKEMVEEEMQQVEEIEITKASHEKPGPPKSKLNENKIDGIAKRIIDLIEQEKLYQETELTLQDLAARLQIPTYQVSQAINEGMNKNFYDLVNGYRVEEAKRLLQDPKNMNYTILSVGFDAGFNSKTTFNTVFKKFTGLTPTNFRESQRVDLAEV